MDKECLRELIKPKVVQDNIANAIGIPLTCLDLKGNCIQKPLNPSRRFCELIRATKEGEKRCRKCDQKHIDLAINTKKFQRYECHAGLTDFVVPIKLEEKMIGVVIGGQILLKEPDEKKRKKVKKIANELGINENEILEALGKVPIKKEEDVDYSIIKMIEEVGSLISKLAYDRTKKEEEQGVLDEVASILTSRLELEEVLNDILTKAIKLVNPTAHGRIRLIDAKKQLLIVKATRGYEKKEDIPPWEVGECIAGWVAKTGEPEKIDDVQKDERFKKALEKIKSSEYKAYLKTIHSEIAVPLKIGKRTMGVLNIHSEKKNAFTDEDTEFLMRIATIAAIAIENDKLFKALSTGANRLNPPIKESEVFESIINEVCELMCTSSCSIWILDRTIKKLKIRRSVGLTKKYEKEAEIDLDDEISGKAMRDKVPVTVRNIKTDPRIKYRNELTEMGYVSLLSVPVIAKERAIGTINIYTKEEYEFTKNEQELLSIFAQQVGGIIEIIKMKKQLEALEEIEHKAIIGELQNEDILRLILEKGRELVEFDSAHIRLIDKEKKELVPGVAIGHLKGQHLVKRKIGEGITGYVALTKEALIVGDVRKNEKFMQVLKNTKDKEYKKYLEGVRSELAVPVLCKKTIIGVLSVRSSKLNAFTDDDKQILESLADHAAMIIENARINEDLRKKVSVLDFLHQNALLLLSNLDLSQVLQEIVKNTKKVLNADAITLYQYDQEHEEFLCPPLMEGLKHPEIIKRCPIKKDNVLKEILKEGETHFANDAVNDPIMAAGEFVQREDIKSSAGLPLKVDDKIAGILFINFRELHHFTEEERKLIKTCGTYIAIAIYNAQSIHKKLAESEKIAAIGKLTAGATHGFKQPMQVIKNQIEMLKEKKDLKPYKEYLEIIDDRIYQMYEIITVFSRFSNPKIEENIAIDNLLQQTLEKLEIPQKVKISREEGIPSKVNCDPGQIKQVFENLILNACDAMPDGGNLRISTSIDNGKVKIIFKDEGMGIPDYAKEKVFDPFFTTKKGKGSGLGLYISQFIIQNHKGNIHFESKEGKGTTFTVELPTSI